MTATVHRIDGKLERISFKCDHKSCTAADPSDSEIIAGGGMLKMGWSVRFNSIKRRNDHFCPEHRP